nr:polyprenyl synthetase family protein [uncultured Porphyromonas sp.]
MDQLDKIKAPIATLVDNFHSQFAEILATKSEWLGRAIELLSASTGKKVRPILVALLSGLPEGKSPAQRSIDAAVLLELIHTATLIHDDVIDEAKTRRGRPTLGAIFDNRVAVLMGDFILSSALIGAIALRDLEVMAIVSGIGRELTEGEIRQFESADSLRLDEANYYEIIRQKTAVLFASCARIAAITTGASTEDKERFTQIGELLGMAFQIRDDIFDYYKGDVGKPTGNDLREGKVTLPLLHVLLQQPDSPETKEALAILSQHPLSEEGVAQLTELAIRGGGIRYAEERLMHYIDEAKQLILHYPDSAYRQSLVVLADYIAARSY